MSTAKLWKLIELVNDCRQEGADLSLHLDEIEALARECIAARDVLKDSTPPAGKADLCGAYDTFVIRTDEMLERYS